MFSLKDVLRMEVAPALGCTEPTAIALAGAAMLSLASEPEAGSPNPALGNFYEFLAMVCSTGYIITVKRLPDRYYPLVLTGIQSLAGAIFFFPFLFLAEMPFVANPPLADVTALLYLGTFVNVGAYGLYNFGVSRVPASQATGFVNLIPVFTVILGWLVLGERFTSLQYVASAMVLTGVLISQNRAGRTEPVAAETAA